MNCPKCGCKLKTVNSYASPDGISVRRMVCTDDKCGSVVVAQVEIKILEINPPKGSGATVIAKRRSRP